MALGNPRPPKAHTHTHTLGLNFSALGQGNLSEGKSYTKFFLEPPLTTVNTWTTLFTRNGVSDLFLRSFREGISFPNFVERSTPDLPLSKLCAVPFALQNRALFEGENRAKMCREKGRKRGGQQRGQKGKKDA